MSSVQPWQANTQYTQGAQVEHQGTLYSLIQPHTSLPGWEPPQVPALWAPVNSQPAPAQASAAAPPPARPSQPGNDGKSADKNGAPQAGVACPPPVEDAPQQVYQQGSSSAPCGGDTDAGSRDGYYAPKPAGYTD